MGSIPGLGRSPGEGKGYPPQYAHLDLNPLSGLGCKESDRTERLALSLFIITSMTDIWQRAMVRNPWGTFQTWQETKKERSSRPLNHSSCLPFMLISFQSQKVADPCEWLLERFTRPVEFFLSEFQFRIPFWFFFSVFERYIRCHVLLCREGKENQWFYILWNWLSFIIFCMLTSCYFPCLKCSWILDCRQCHIIIMQRKYHAFTTVQRVTKSWTWLKWLST